MIQPSDVFIERGRFWVRQPSGAPRRLDAAGIRYFHALGQRDADHRAGASNGS